MSLISEALRKANLADENDRGASNSTPMPGSLVHMHQQRQGPAASLNGIFFSIFGLAGICLAAGLVMMTMDSVRGGWSGVDRSTLAPLDEMLITTTPSVHDGSVADGALGDSSRAGARERGDAGGMSINWPLAKAVRAAGLAPKLLSPESADVRGSANDRRSQPDATDNAGSMRAWIEAHLKKNPPAGENESAQSGSEAGDASALVEPPAPLRPLVPGRTYRQVLEVSDAPKLRLDGISWSLYARGAIINQTMVEPGSELEDVWVIAIEPMRVLLRHEGREFYLAMP
ncbi:MAG: hypothetical protein JJU36_02085 [Phycisphaeraceae bacterium]|nr:hypothetical protein [Phycisphaeraceae bacterium]